MSDNYRPDYVAFTDGSAKKRGKGYAAGSGLVIVKMDDMSMAESSKTLGNQTNNYAELKAILMALKKISKDEDECEILIVTDSNYCCQSLGKYVHGWAKDKGPNDIWRSASGAVKNQDLIKEIYFNHIKSDLSIKFVHMNSHLDYKSNVDVAKVRKSLKSVGLIISEKTAKQFIKLNDRADILADEAAKKS